MKYSLKWFFVSKVLCCRIKWYLCCKIDKLPLKILTSLFLKIICRVYFEINTLKALYSPCNHKMVGKQNFDLNSFWNVIKRENLWIPC